MVVTRSASTMTSQGALEHVLGNVLGYPDDHPVRLALAYFGVNDINAFTMFEDNAFARMGGGRSFGSRGSRSYSAPRQYKSPEPSRQQAAPSQGQAAPAGPAGGGFMRGLGGGILGGV